MTEDSIFVIIIIFVCHNLSETAQPTVSTLLADEAWFVHKLTQVELQLDRSQLSYSEYSGPLPQKAVQPNAQYKKGPYTLLYIYVDNSIKKYKKLRKWYIELLKI